MSSTLQRLINVTLKELWQLMSQVMSYIQRRTNVLKLQDAEVESPSPASTEQRKVSARDVLMSTRGSWGSRTLDEIDAELDRQRQDDWGDIK
jgi:hypothetical protein